MPADDFSWSEGGIVLHRQAATAVYCNEAGQIVIRQEGGYPEQDTLIFLSGKENVEAVITALANAMELRWCVS